MLFARQRKRATKVSCALVTGRGWLGGGGGSGRERGGRDAFLGVVVVVVVVGGRGDAGKRLDRICMRMYGVCGRYALKVEDSYG